MPAFVVPARSGAHRVAAIALYRALLTQCSAAATPSLPLADDQRTALRNVIRNKFRRNRHVHSTRLLKLSFTAGYELLDALDRAAAAATTTTTTTDSATQPLATMLASLLPAAPEHLTRDPVAHALVPRGPKRLHPSPEACPPPEGRVLNKRPVPAAALGGTGVRRVPRLVSANLFPMLRLRKPQPRSLSRVLTDKIKQRQRRLNLRSEMQEYWTKLGLNEDVWDALVDTEMEDGADDAEASDETAGAGDGGDGLRDDKEDGVGGEEEESWADQPIKVAKTISWKLSMQKKETIQMVQRMQDLVDSEEALAKEERQARQKRREMARLEAKRAEEVKALAGKAKAGEKGGQPL